MELADPHRSYAVLIGSAAFASPALEDLPAVANNLVRLAELLRDPAVWGLPADRCLVVPEPASPAEVLDAVHQAAGQVEDTLLVYYSGHGLAHQDVNGLLLSLPRTDPQRPYTAVDFDALRREVLGTRRGVSRIVILDCCYSGRALEGGMSGATGPVQVAEQTRISGSYLLTASAATRQAQSPPGETYTAFTGELIGLLEGGVPGGESLIEVSRIYEHLHAELRAKGRPLPQQRLSNTGRTLSFARNRYGRPGANPAPAPARTAVPERWRQILRGKPRDIAAAATGSPEDNAELLSYAGRLRPVQEVATLVWLLTGEERRAERDVLHEAVADREPQEIAAYLEALEALEGVEEGERQLLEKVSRRPAQTIAATVRDLRAGGYDRQRRRLLEGVRGRLRTTDDILDLLGALSSAGLDEEADALLRTVAPDSPEEAVVLADALLTIGRSGNAFELYLAHARVVAARPVAEVVRVLQAMTGAERDDAAGQLLRAAVFGNPSSAVARLCDSLSSSGLNSWALEAVRIAAGMPTEDVLALCDDLRDRGRDATVLHLLRTAVLARPLPDVPQLVDALREMGRPVDAKALLARAAEREPEDAVELWRRFTAQGRERDAESLLTALDGRPASYRLRTVSAICTERHKAVRDTPSPPVGGDPLLVRLLDGLSTADERDWLDTLSMLRQADEPTAMHALLAALTWHDPDLAEQRLALLDTKARAAEGAVLRTLLRAAGRTSVADVNPGDMRIAVGRTSIVPRESVYAMAALCAAGRESLVVNILGVAYSPQPRVAADVLARMRGHGLTKCARALIRRQSHLQTEYPATWALLLEEMSGRGLDDYVAFARTLEPPPVPSPPPAAPTGRRRGWLRGRSE